MDNIDRANAEACVPLEPLVRPFEVTITPGPDQATATWQEADAALCALFLGLTNAIGRGYEVDISEPSRIIIRSVA